MRGGATSRGLIACLRLQPWLLLVREVYRLRHHAYAAQRHLNSIDDPEIAGASTEIATQLLMDTVTIRIGSRVMIS